MSLEIGRAKHGARGFTKYKMFYLKSEHDKGGAKGGSNIFRVIPPIKSLARDPQGRYAVYYAVHKGFVGTDGKPRYFQCPQEYDFKQKLVTRHCPVCDRAKDLERQLADAQKKYEGQKDKLEKLNDWRKANIEPIQASKKYYVNVCDQQNEVGYLELPIKAHTDLKATADKYDAKGVDIMGMRGLFLDFQKVSRFKGDNQAIYKVEIYRQPVPGKVDGEPVVHELTPELINKIETDAPDLLKDLFNVIPYEDIELLAKSEGEERKKLVDRIFSNGQQEQTKDPILEAGIPGTNATAVGRIDLDRGLDPIMPDIGGLTSAQAPSSTYMAPTSTPAAPAATAPSAPSTQAPAAPAAQPSTRAGSMSISDEQFDKLFGTG